MKRKPKKKAAKPAATEKKSFEGGSGTRQTSSWVLSGLSADAEIRTHLFTLRNRCRDLERNNDYARAFFDDVEANTLGSEGVVLQMKIKEEADRVINSPDEKAYIQHYEETVNDRRKMVRSILTRRGVDAKRVEQFFPNITLLHRNGNRAAKVLKGQPDVFAINLIEKAFKRFSEKENFTVTRELTRGESERMWIRSTSRDGGTLVHKVKGFDNEFKFSLEFIDIDWLDLNLNTTLENGNEIRMGKEFNQWKQCVAYHIIVRRPGDWMWATANSSLGGNNANKYARRRIDASEIIHGYVRERVDQSREIPWLVSAITRLQMLGRYEEAELVASLLSARKTGTWYSDLFSDNQTLTKDFSMTERGEFEEATEPGQDSIAPYGWKYQVNDPTHPNSNVEQFRKVMLQGIAAGLPGASYHRISQDPSGLSFSNLRGIELQSREGWMMIQSFMKTNFHNAIFPAFLESALLSGIVPLPMSKFEKFNVPSWVFRRWKGVDPIKEAEANKMNIALCNTSRTRVAAESGADFDEVVEDLIIEEGRLETSGLQALMLDNLLGVKGDGNSTTDGSNPGDPNFAGNPNDTTE